MSGKKADGLEMRTYIIEIRIEILRLADMRKTADDTLGEMYDICSTCMIDLNRIFRRSPVVSSIQDTVRHC